MRIPALLVIVPALAAQQLSVFEVHLASGKAAVQQSRYSEAEKQLRAAIADGEALDAKDPASAARLADALETLCDLDLLMGKYPEAIALQEKAVTALEALPNADLAPHLLRLAGTLRAGGHTPQAEPVLLRAIGLDEHGLGPDDARVAAEWDSLGSVYVELKKNEAARNSYQMALKSRVNRLGPDHIDVANSYLNLGGLEEKDKKPKEARADYEKALAISEKKLGDESYSLTGILDRLGLLLRREKNFGEAEPVLQRALSIREKTLGARHADVAQALDNLALTYFYDSKHAEAEPLFTRSLQIWLATQGPYSPLVAQALDNLGSLYSAQQKYADAEPLFRRALAIREQQDIESLSNLAALYEQTKDMKKVETYFQRAILIGEKGLGGDHYEIADTMEAYATFLANSGRMAEAKKLKLHIQELRDRPHQ